MMWKRTAEILCRARSLEQKVQGIIIFIYNEITDDTGAVLVEVTVKNKLT
jgi:hypothetical protein